MSISNSSFQYDAIIIGAGHNGLVCANLLARSGRRVLMLEANSSVGGLARSRKFGDGFQASIADTLPQLKKQLVKDLQLEKHGFELAGEALHTIALNLNDQPIHIYPDRLQGVSDKDNESYQDYVRLLTKFAKAIDPFWYKTPPLIGSPGWKDKLTLAQFGWRLRRLGRQDMAEFMRIIALPAQDLMDEFFDSEELKAALSWDFITGNKLAPRSPNNAVLNQLLRLSGDLAGNNVYNSAALLVAKSGTLIQAMASAARSAGVEIRLESPVARIIIENQLVAGAQLEDGSIIHCPLVISNADPKTSYLKLLGGQYLEIEFAHRIKRNRNRGMVAKLHLGLDKLPNFSNLKDANGRLLIAPSRSYLENAFDSTKYAECSDQLAMEIIIPSLQDSSVSPNNKHLLSARIQYLPYEINGGWVQHKPKVLENILTTLEKYAPGIRQSIVARDFLTPHDLAQQHRVDGGHWHHGEFCIDQWWMNRPTYGASKYKAPNLEGFYLCGAGTHPGGGIMGAAGSNCAKEIINNE